MCSKWQRKGAEGEGGAKGGDGGGGCGEGGGGGALPSQSSGYAGEGGGNGGFGGGGSGCGGGGLMADQRVLAGGRVCRPVRRDQKSFRLGP